MSVSGELFADWKDRHARQGAEAALQSLLAWVDEGIKTGQSLGTGSHAKVAVDTLNHVRAKIVEELAGMRAEIEQ